MIKSGYRTIEYGLRKKNDPYQENGSHLENGDRSQLYHFPFLFESLDGPVHRDGAGTGQGVVVGD
jgi:hypothetical protein